MSKSFFNDLGEAYLIYKFRNVIVIGGLILLGIFIWGYFKFAVPVYDKIENRSKYADQIDSDTEFQETYSSYENIVQTKEQETKVYESYLESKNDISKEEITTLRNNLLDAFKNGKGAFIVYEKDKEAIAKCSEELLVKYLDSTYSFDKKPNGNSYYYTYNINGKWCTAVDAEVLINKLVKNKYGYILDDYPNT